MTQTPDNQAAPLSEYEWVSNGNKMTGQLSEQDAKTMGATPLGANGQATMTQDAPEAEQSATERGDSDLAESSDSNVMTSTKAAAKPANKSRS